jgi:ribosomal protein S18 acetylase RimI-like enzyme
MAFRIEKATDGGPLWPLIEQHFPRAVRWLRDPGDTGDYHFFVAVDEQDGFVGGAVIDVGSIDYGPLTGQIEGFLEDIEVAAPFRRRGIGTALMRRTLAFAWARGARHVRWTVACDNAAAVPFYDSLGAALLPERDDQNPDDEYYVVVALRPKEPSSAAV